MQTARSKIADTALAIGSKRGWERLIAAHEEARQRYCECAIKAAEALKRRCEIERRKPSQVRLSAQLEHADRVAAASRDEISAEAEADRAHEELLRLERLALARPATTPGALRFKLALLSDCGLEGREQEWRVFLADCARLGGHEAW